MKILFILNDAPYGSEKPYNAFRLANQLTKDNSSAEVRIFLMADAVQCAVGGQNTPNGYYNIERMLKLLLSKGSLVKLCGTCTEARGLQTIPLMEGIEMSNMAELSNWVVESDKILVF